MFVDASVIVAIVARENDAQQLMQKVAAATDCFTSPIAIYEAALGVARALDLAHSEAKTLVDDLLRETQTQIVSVNEDMSTSALEAFSRFGKGRHPAKLNMGDCFAYACAKQLGVPLLFKGGDFAKTDIQVA